MIIYLILWVVFAVLAGAAVDEIPVVGFLFFAVSIFCGIQGWSAV